MANTPSNNPEQVRKERIKSFIESGYATTNLASLELKEAELKRKLARMDGLADNTESVAEIKKILTEEGGLKIDDFKDRLKVYEDKLKAVETAIAARDGSLVSDRARNVINLDIPALEAAKNATTDATTARTEAEDKLAQAEKEGVLPAFTEFLTLAKEWVDQGLGAIAAAKDEINILKVELAKDDARIAALEKTKVELLEEIEAFDPSLNTSVYSARKRLYEIEDDQGNPSAYKKMEDFADSIIYDDIYEKFVNQFKIPGFDRIAELPKLKTDADGDVEIEHDAATNKLNVKFETDGSAELTDLLDKVTKQLSALPNANTKNAWATLKINGAEVFPNCKKTIKLRTIREVGEDKAAVRKLTLKSAVTFSKTEVAPAEAKKYVAEDIDTDVYDFGGTLNAGEVYYKDEDEAAKDSLITDVSKRLFNPEESASDALSPEDTASAFERAQVLENTIAQWAPKVRQMVALKKEALLDIENSGTLAFFAEVAETTAKLDFINDELTTHTSDQEERKSRFEELGANDDGSPADTVAEADTNRQAKISRAAEVPQKLKELDSKIRVVLKLMKDSGWRLDAADVHNTVAQFVERDILNTPQLRRLIDDIILPEPELSVAELATKPAPEFQAYYQALEELLNEPRTVAQLETIVENLEQEKEAELRRARLAQRDIEQKQGAARTYRNTELLAKAKPEARRKIEAELSLEQGKIAAEMTHMTEGMKRLEQGIKSTYRSEVQPLRDTIDAQVLTLQAVRQDLHAAQKTEHDANKLLAQITKTITDLSDAGLDADIKKRFTGAEAMHAGDLEDFIDLVVTPKSGPAIEAEVRTELVGVLAEKSQAGSLGRTTSVANFMNAHKGTLRLVHSARSAERSTRQDVEAAQRKVLTNHITALETILGNYETEKKAIGDQKTVFESNLKKAEKRVAEETTSHDGRIGKIDGLIAKYNDSTTRGVTKEEANKRIIHLEALQNTINEYLVDPAKYLEIEDIKKLPLIIPENLQKSDTGNVVSSLKTVESLLPDYAQIAEEAFHSLGRRRNASREVSEWTARNTNAQQLIEFLNKEITIQKDHITDLKAKGLLVVPPKPNF